MRGNLRVLIVVDQGGPCETLSYGRKGLCSVGDWGGERGRKKRGTYYGRGGGRGIDGKKVNKSKRRVQDLEGKKRRNSG